MFILYNILLTLAAPIWVPYVLWLIYKSKGKINWRELCGEYQIDFNTHNIWVHAVSGGEVIAATSILKKLKEQRPEYRIILTTTTLTGHEAAKRLEGSSVDQVLFFPLDVARFQLSAMSRVKPKVVVIMETELWMNFLWAAKVVGAKTMIVNGRISDQSFPKKLTFRFFYKVLLKNLDAAYVQTKLDADRFKVLGTSNVEIIGNSKYDQALDTTQDVDVQEWRDKLYIPKDKMVIVIGTTRSRMEEKMLLRVLINLDLSQIHVIHAPRHLEHIPEIIKDLKENNISCSLRSNPIQGATYTLLDTFGELSQVYALADLVILGGSFEDQVVGANLMQPLALAKPVIHGKGMKNFAEASQMANQMGATVIVSSPDELAKCIKDLLKNSLKREELSHKALAFVQTNLGASEQYAREL